MFKYSPWRELYVGNLSYFCEEHHLWDLFGRIGNVDRCHIIRNYDRTRSLSYGFVCMTTVEEALFAIKVLNDQMFMGRALK